MDADKHQCITVGISAVYLQGVDYGQALVRRMVFFPFYLDRCLSVQRVEEFNLLVPVQGVISPWRCEICQLYSQTADFLKCKERNSMKERIKKYFEENAAVMISGLMMTSGSGNAYNLYRMMK